MGPFIFCEKAHTFKLLHSPSCHFVGSRAGCPCNDPFKKKKKSSNIWESVFTFCRRRASVYSRRGSFLSHGLLGVCLVVAQVSI